MMKSYQNIKGQLISKNVFWYLQFSQKMNEKIRLYCYDTSGRLVFVRLLEGIDDPQSFRSSFGGNRQPPKNISKLSDLYSLFRNCNIMWRSGFRSSKSRTRKIWKLLAFILPMLLETRVFLWKCHTSTTHANPMQVKEFCNRGRGLSAWILPFWSKNSKTDMDSLKQFLCMAPDQKMVK